MWPSAGPVSGVLLESMFAPVIVPDVAVAGGLLTMSIAAVALIVVSARPMSRRLSSKSSRNTASALKALQAFEELSARPREPMTRSLETKRAAPKAAEPQPSFAWWLGCCSCRGRDDDDLEPLEPEPVVLTSASSSTSSRSSRASEESLNPELCLVRPDERAAMDALASALAPELRTLPQWDDLVGERCLLRFYRGHGTVPKAAEAYRKMLQWRKDHNADELRRAVADLPWSMGAVPGMGEVEKVFPIDIAAGQSPEGHVVWIERSGCLNLDRFKSISDKDFQRTWGGLMELRTRHLDDLSKAQGRLVKVVQIRDLRGFSASLYLSLVSSGVLKRLQNIILGSMSAHPESIHKVVMLNMPRAFNSLWALMKPLLTDRMQKKFHFLPHPHDSRKLYEVVGAESLLALAKLAAPTLPCPGASSTAVASEDFVELALRVPAGGKVSWNFSSNGELVFSLLEFPEAECQVDLAATVVQPRSTSGGEGSHTSVRDSVCVLRWSNSQGSAFSSGRKLSYSVELV